MLWLVENRPDSEILGSPYAVFQPGELKPEEFQRATRMWDSTIKTHPSDARVWGNAANFYRPINHRLYVTSLEKAVALAPNNEYYSRQLGEVYAGAILTMDQQSIYRDPGGPDPDLARRARDVLHSTNNALLLEPAVRLLQSEYNRSLMMRKENVALGQLARRYFLRAKTLDPNIDEVWIYPKIDPNMIGMLARIIHVFYFFRRREKPPVLQTCYPCRFEATTEAYA